MAYNFYGVTEKFTKDFLFTCDRENIEKAKQSILPIEENYLFIIRDYDYTTYPFGNKEMDGFVYHNYTILDLELNEMFLLLKNFRINPRINHTWSGRMSNQYVKYELEDTNNGGGNCTKNV